MSSEADAKWPEIRLRLEEAEETPRASSFGWSASSSGSQEGVRDLWEVAEGERSWTRVGVGEWLGRGEPEGSRWARQSWEGVSFSGQGERGAWTASRRRCFQRPRGRLRERGGTGTGAGRGGRGGAMKASMSGAVKGERASGHAEEQKARRSVYIPGGGSQPDCVRWATSSPGQA